MRRLILLALWLSASLARAQTPGSCALGTAQADLATADLSARLFNTGSLFYGNGTAYEYYVPRSSGNSPIFSSSLWLSGTVGGDLRVAGGTYGAPSFDFTFWPGPLDPGATLPDPADCSAFDRIYVVSPEDIAAYEGGAPATDDLRDWPVGLGAPAVDVLGEPVPVTSRGQRLDLPGGERPVVYGGPTAFWVMNDVGGDHGTEGTAPLGVEVRVSAFAVSSGPSYLRQSTFYRYTVVNRNTAPIEDLRAGFFADPDLGDAADDYVGVDTTRGMAFVYNADNVDGSGAGTSYGTDPPAVGYDLLSGLATSSYTSGGGGTAEPNTGAEVYARMQSLWNDGTVIREYGNGYMQTQGAVTTFTFPGDPVTGAFWSEVDSGVGPNAAGDRTFMMASPPSTLAPGASRSFDLAIVFAQGADHLQSVTALRSVSDAVQFSYDAGALFSGAFPEGTAAAPALVAPADGARFYETAVTFEWEPVPDADYYVLEVSPAADFAEADVAVIQGTEATFPATRFPANRTAPLYWRVRTGRDGLDGPPSPARAVSVYRYVAGPVRLASGAPAYVETTAPGGAAACAGSSDPDEGCAEVGGDLVFNSPNSTGDYLVVTEGLDPAFWPSEFEVRFTAAGSIATTLVGTPRLFRVPFEVWDVGPVVPGAANDPADDRQLVARLGIVTPGGCTFAYARPTVTGAGLTTRSVSASYATGAGYADFAAVAEPIVAADPAGCPTGSAATQPARDRIDVARGTPISNLVFEQAGPRTPAELAGSTIRFYTNDRVVVAEGGPSSGALALGAPYPNPVRGVATVPYAVGAAGPVRLRLVDVLGRTVAVLAEGPVAAGAHEARLDTRALAPGIYAIVFDAGDARAVRTLTVVR